MKRTLLWLVAVLPAITLAGGDMTDPIDLPRPRADGGLSVERALHQRRAVRDFGQTPLPLQQAGQLLWSAQGITHGDGLRTAPSAGALYPLQLYLVAGNVTGLRPGIYRYEPERHRLCRVSAGDRRAQVAQAALEQSWIAQAPAIVVFGAIEQRTTRKYGTILFAWCNLRCLLCQNWDISQKGVGEAVSAEALAAMMLRLQEMGCHNINRRVSVTVGNRGSPMAVVRSRHFHGLNAVPTQMRNSGDPATSRTRSAR